MGLFSSSSKSTSNQTTNNSSTTIGLAEDSTGFFGNGNKLLNDYSITELSGQLAGANVSGQVNITDGGAFDLLSQGFDSALNLVNDVSYGAFDSVNSATAGALAGMENTAYAAVDRNSDLAVNAVLSGNDLARDLAAESNLLNRESLAFGGELFRDLLSTTEQVTSSGDQMQLDSMRYALQFADNASRSDGQQLALSQTKSLTWIILGLGAAATIAVIAFNRK